MALGTQSGCINHPGFEATTRCKQCGKPICAKCIVAAPTGTFCSVLCREKYEEFIKRADLLERSKGSPGLGNLIRKIRRFIFKTIMWLIVLVILGVVLSFMGINVPVISNFIHR